VPSVPGGRHEVRGYHAGVLDGRAAFVTHASTSLGRSLATALAELGATVSTSAERFGERASAEAAFTAAPAIDVVVHVCVDDDALVPQPLADTDPHEWDARGEALLRDAIFTFQAAHSRFSPTGTGRVVLLAPTSGFTGAGGFVPASTAIEGARALAKSAARQWGRQAITVNTILVPPALVTPELVAATTFEAPPAVGQLPDVRDDVAATIAHFAAPTSGGISGSTLIVDGGSVMAP
jgi:3-oxoacyl-[acyl-carrier protein] reductase